MRSERAVTVYQKLVRDRIPEVIEANGGTARCRVLDPGELVPALVAKLHEEADELAGADPADRLAELADLREVLSTLTAVLGFTEAQVARAADEKRAARGGFAGRIWLEETVG